MGRKKKKDEGAGENDKRDAEAREKERRREKEREVAYESDSSSGPDAPLVKGGPYEMDSEIQEFASEFGILDVSLVQRFNDIMIEIRHRTWEQDLERMRELLQDAHTPASILALKVRDMENGKFVGKAKCGPKVKEMAKRFGLDRGASTKLEEAMAMREAMGKNTDKDLEHLSSHLEASNKPSALVSMKLADLRKGLNVGHCIYGRPEAPAPGNKTPGVDGVGVLDKPRRRVAVGYTDRELDQRFGAEGFGGGGGGGQLMDEATARKMIAMERQKTQAKDKVPPKDEDRGRRSPSYRGSDRRKRRDASRSRDRDRGRSRSRGRRR